MRMSTVDQLTMIQMGIEILIYYMHNGNYDIIKKHSV